jgi:protein-tyrosine phosphatase
MMSEIIPNQLFLGNVLHVNRLQWLNQKNIQTIVCVASKEDVTIREEIRSCKTVHQFELVDNLTQKLDFDSVITVIEDALKQGAVLVNCAVGLSRSPTFVIAYLMKTKKMSLNEAYHMVKRARPKINPNSSFMRQLQEYEVNLASKNTITN